MPCCVRRDAQAAARPLLAWPTDGLAPPHTPERLWTQRTVMAAGTRDGMRMLRADDLCDMVCVDMGRAVPDYPFRDAPLERAVRHWHM